MDVSERTAYAELTVDTASAEETRSLAQRLAALLAPGDFVALVGPLGAGKTCFVQGLAQGLTVEGAVTSPTFVLMRLHRGDRPLCHVDAYRLHGAGELLDLGVDDWCGESIVAVEWADHVAAALPDVRLEVILEYAGEGRRVIVRGLGPRPAQIVERMRSDEPAGD